MYYRQCQQDGAGEGCWHGAKESSQCDGGRGGPTAVTDQAGHYPSTLYCSQKGKLTQYKFILKVNYEGKPSNLKVDNAKGWLLFNVHVVVMIILTDIY